MTDFALIGEAIMLAMRTAMEWESTSTPLD